MLNNIFWPQYVTAVIILTASWYAYLAMPFKLIKFAAPLKSPIPAVASAPVIGAIKPDKGTLIYSNDNLNRLHFYRAI